MVPELLIIKDSSPNQDNEVDSITGATGTSNAFMNLLNASIKHIKMLGIIGRRNPYEKWIRIKYTKWYNILKDGISKK